ncbi:MAG: RsbRD N-terminal domain-containing protein [Desulfobacterales bacterium]|nr:RsbRD N-terminal domain-containing protein [Desulfobacterales bacterium]
MDLKNLLLRKKSPIVKKWCEVVLRTYPEGGQAFLKKKDRFGNPVGHTIAEGIESIFDELLQGTKSDKIPLFFDNILRLRAVQDFSPSKAVGFVFGLKKVIRKELGSKLLKDGTSEEWAAFESEIDGMGLLCFDIYTQCREKIFDIRIKALRNQSHRLLKMAGVAYDLPEDYELSEEDRDLKKAHANKSH